MGARTALLSALLVSFLCATAVSMPLRPDLVVKLEDEGRLGEARETLLLSAAELEERRALAARDSIEILVILVDFDDVPADTILHSKATYQHLLFSGDNQYSLTNFYDWSSYGSLHISGDIYGWFRVPEPLSYYANERRGMGNYPQNTQRMVEDAVEAADGVVDFSRYDNDGPDGIPSSGDDDGFVDFLFVIHGGQGYEWTMNPNHIHSHVATIRAKQVDGVYVKTYATEPEDGRVGTYAHELGHLLGLPDLYDVTLNSFGLGMWSLMAYGSWGGGDGSRPVGLDAWCRYKLGFLEPATLDTNLIGYRLPCIEDGPHALRLWSNGADGPQYFLVENRRAKAWDEFLSWFGEGLLIYHVDERIRDNSLEGDHLVSLEQADGRFDLEQRRLWGFGSDGGDPFPGSESNREFTWWTLPDNYSNEGLPTEVSLRRIGDPGDTVSFDVEVRSPIIVFDSYVIDDRRGDRDGTPDPGEETQVKIKFRNYGSGARNVVVRIRTDDPNVHPREAVVGTDLIPSNSLSGEMVFDAVFGADIPEPYQVVYSLEIEAEHDCGGYASNDQFIISVPLRLVAGWPQTAGDMLSSPVAVADIDGDGLDEIVVGCANRRVYAWNHDGTSIPGWPVFAGGLVTGKPAICDVDIDGNADVIVSSQDGRVYVFENDGRRMNGWPQATGAAILSSPLLSDIDDDGLVEIVCGSTDGQVYAWNEDGKRVKGWPVKLGGPEVWMSPAAADLDGDHVCEIIVGGYGGSLYVLNGEGKTLPGWPVLVGRGCGRGSPSLADFDGDGTLDIAVSGLFANSVYLVGSDGRVKEGWPAWSYNCESLSSPIPADVDNDGLPEVAVATSCGTIVAWNSDGSVCDAASGQAANPVYHCEPLFVDLDGNNTVEGMVGTSGKDTSEIDAFGPNGRVLGFPIRVPGRVWSTPAITDVEHDGTAEVVVATTSGEVQMWRFIGARPVGRAEYSQSRGDIWNTGLYGFSPNANAPMADLALSAGDITLRPDRPRVGDTVSVNVVVTNSGHWTAEAFDVSLYCDEVAESTMVSSIEITSLGAKRDTTIAFAWRVPPGKASRLAVVALDPDDDVVELSELNNQAGKRYYLAVPDLEIAIRRVEPFPVVVGETLSVHAVLRNLGEDRAEDFRLAFYDSVISDRTCFAAYDVDSLGPGDSLSLAPGYRIDGFKDDYLSIFGVVDEEGVVLEYHHSNNTARCDVNSGIAGKVLVAADYAPVSGMTASRTHVALESPQGRTILIMEAVEPYRTAFETMGSDADLSRTAVVFSKGGDIVGYDLQDSVMFVVSTSPADDIEPVIWGENIAWISETATGRRLMLARSSAAPETVRTVPGFGMAGPGLSSEFLVWQEAGAHGWDIMAFSLAGDSVITVCDDLGDQINPTSWGEVVVWEDHSSGQGDISGVNLGTGTAFQVVADPAPQAYPMISGDIVVWQDMRNGNWDIYGYSLVDGVEFPISRQIDDQIMPSLSDSTVFWIDHRAPIDAIMGLRFGGIRKAADIRRLEALSQDGKISLLLDVDEYSDAITYRLYRYPDGRAMSEDRFLHIRTEFHLGADTIHVYSDTLVAARRPFFYTLGVIDGYGDETFYGPVSGWAYASAPKELLLGNPFPNPCRGEVTFNFGLPRDYQVEDDQSWPDPKDHPRAVGVGVYSVTGRLVRTVMAGAMTPGYYRFEWDGKDDAGRKVSSGVYFIQAQTGASGLSRKVILLR
jgi:immune inhibitor A